MSISIFILVVSYFFPLTFFLSLSLFLTLTLTLTLVRHRVSYRRAGPPALPEPRRPRPHY